MDKILSVSKCVPVVDSLEHASKPSGSIIMGNLPDKCELASQKDSHAMELEFKKMCYFCCQVCNTAVLVWCVSSALEHRSDPCVQDWLHSAQLSQILLSLAHDICYNKTDMEAKQILECCFDKIRDGGMYTDSS